MEASQQTVTLESKRDGQGNPLLNDCTLHTGFGAIIFKHGRAEVPVSVARGLTEARSDVFVPEWSYGGGPPADAEPAAEPAPATPEQHVPPPEPEPTPPETEDEEERQRREAAEYLERERLENPDEIPDEPPPGEPPAKPEPGKVIPPGFASYTAEGAPRCLAAKADGSQCANEAKLDDGVPTWACGLAPHKEQVAALPDGARRVASPPRRVP